MARRPPRRRSSPPKRRPSRSRGRRSPARKSTARRRPGRKRKAAAPAHGFFTWLLFWPFLLVQRLTHRWHGVFRFPARLVGHLAVLACLLFAAVAVFYYVRSLRYDLDRVAEMPARSIIFDRNHKQLGRIHGEHRYIVDLEEVSPNFQKALLAREDKGFYNHPGVDVRGVMRAVYQNFKRRRFAQGASTLSMQLARNAFELPTSGGWKVELDRKFLELALTFRIEARYSKDEILQHYMNLIFWGGSVHGVEAASRTYLEKSAKDLTLSEGAMLAGIIRAPNAFSPFEDLAKTKRERDQTLDNMLRYGFATETQVAAAKAEPLHIRPPDRRIIQDSYAMDAVRRDLERILEENNIKLGGLQIITTIDKNLQDAAERSLDQHLRSIERSPGYRHQTRLAWQNLSAGSRGAPNYLQGAVVILENNSGAVLSVVGGRDADESKFNRALHAKRQIGSVFKPFVYLSAFNEGLLPETFISDDRIQPGQIDHAPDRWSPNNSDGKYYEIVKVKEALVKSRNTSSVRVGDYAGLEKVAEVARMAGFQNRIPRMPASFLGTWEATPWEVASAYTMFPNGGIRYRPFLIQEIRDREGRTLYRTDPLNYRAARAGAAWEVSNILEEVTQRGTASSMRSRYDFREPAAGKTGTTDNYQDAWFVGYTTSLTCAVWVGLDQPKTIMSSGYGSRLALPIWVNTMKTAKRLGRYQFKDFAPNVTLVDCHLCRYSGKRATGGCAAAESDYKDKVPEDLVPAANDFCTIHPLRAQPVNGSAPPRAIPIGEPRAPRRSARRGGVLRAVPVR
ncbi:MAG: PBP1A family penicillin-binding protein [Akkermansiaceae bacterium]|nr:PBP1A family penicillin-binding protein [Akkermansiaceae bacterium]